MAAKRRPLSEVMADILETLCQIRRDAGEPRMGTREVELARRDRLIFVALTVLRSEGKIARGDGYCWVTEEAFAAWESSERAEGQA